MVHATADEKARARLPELCQSVQKQLLVSANWDGQRGRRGRVGGKGGVCIRPTEHGLPPTMLKPREPPSRRRTTVTLLASPSYGQTEERQTGQTGRTGNLSSQMVKPEPLDSDWTAFLFGLYQRKKWKYPARLSIPSPSRLEHLCYYGDGEAMPVADQAERS